MQTQLKKSQSINFHKIPATNTVIAIALMICIILIFVLVGLSGSFFLNKYITIQRYE